MLYRAAPKQVLTYYVLDVAALKVVKTYTIDTNDQRFPAMKAEELMAGEGFKNPEYILLVKLGGQE